MKNFLIVGFIVLLFAFAPFIMIWSVNTLFPVAAIPYTLETWLAAFLLAGIFRSSAKTVVKESK